MLNEKPLILNTTQHEEWVAKIKKISDRNIVHYPQYFKIYESYGDGIGECFVFECDEGIVIHPYLRRKIPNEQFFTDLITPYGYGGPIAKAFLGQDMQKLVSKFCEAFEKYAIETKTVSQFIRFHPILQNNLHFKGTLNGLALQCKNVAINYGCDNNIVPNQIRARFQTYANKAKRSGLRFVELSLKDYEIKFHSLYSASMDRKKHDGYYRFSMDFIRLLTQNLESNFKCFAVLLGERICSIALCIIYEGHLDYFLAASDYEMLSLYPNHLLVSEISQWASDNGCTDFHLGGGNDSLLFFKQGFSKINRDYYVCRTIFDHEAYEQLTKDHYSKNQTSIEGSSLWFPAYRREFV